MEEIGAGEMAELVKSLYGSRRPWISGTHGKVRHSSVCLQSQL